MDAVTATVIDGQRAFALLDQALWVMLRVGAALMAMPLIGTRAVPARVRVLLAGVLALVFAPLVPTPQWSGLDGVMVVSVLRELALGVVMGFLLRLAFEAGALAGALIAQGSGLAFAQMNDPLRGVASGVLGQWFYLAFGLVFFASDGHLALIELLLRSYQSLPIGAPLPDVSLLLALSGELAPPVQRLFNAAFEAAEPLARP